MSMTARNPLAQGRPDSAPRPMHAEKATDACALARLAADGDAQAFAALMAPLHGRLFNLLRSMVQSAADADEVLQQTLLQVHLGLPKLRTLDGDRALSAWIFRVAVNRGLMHLRGRRRRPVLHLEDVFAQQGSMGVSDDAPLSRPDDTLMHKEMREQLHLAIDALPDKYRLVLWLRDIEEQSNEDVACTLGLTVPTVKARLLRARRFVRGIIAPAKD